MKAGVVVDAWKEAIFDRNFDNAGIAFKKEVGGTIVTYTIETGDLNKVARVVKAANNEAKRSRQ